MEEGEENGKDMVGQQRTWEKQWEKQWDRNRKGRKNGRNWRGHGREVGYGGRCA